MYIFKFYSTVKKSHNSQLGPIFLSDSNKYDAPSFIIKKEHM